MNEADRQEIAALINIAKLEQKTINDEIIKELKRLAGNQEELLKGLQVITELVQHSAADLTAIVGAELVKAHDRAGKAGAPDPKKRKPTGTRKKRETT